MTDVKPRILVVEDDPDDAFFIERAFKKSGVAGLDRILQDGQQAIAYLGGKGPYADRQAFPMPTHVLMDLKLPKASGLEVLGWIRHEAGLRDLRVAILSSSGERTDRDAAQALGIDGYFVKPSRSLDLVEVVHSIARLWSLVPSGA